jgi:hypothetical protein
MRHDERSAALATGRGAAARLRRLWRGRSRLLALGGFVLATVGSCGLPEIKPPGLP